MVLRATAVDRVFLGIDLSSLPPALQPLRKIEQADLAADKILLPQSTMALANGTPGLLVPAGQAPSYFGQPVAILIFGDFATWRRAQRQLQFDESVVRYGAAAPAPPPPKPFPPATYITRSVADGVEEFSQTRNGPSNPYAEPPAPADSEARALRAKMESVFDDPALRQFSGSYGTQVLDPMFMEPESGLAWLEPGAAGARCIWSWHPIDQWRYRQYPRPFRRPGLPDPPRPGGAQRLLSRRRLRRARHFRLSRTAGAGGRLCRRAGQDRQRPLRAVRRRAEAARQPHRAAPGGRFRGPLQGDPEPDEPAGGRRQ
jgi:hypothetical protein